MCPPSTPLATAGRVAVMVTMCAGPACTSDGTPRDRFEETVLPVLEQRCSSPVCHGVGPGAEARGDVVDWSQFVFDVTARGRALDPDHVYEAAKRQINTREDPAFSSLLRKPLAVEQGGLPHYGRVNFTGTGDDAYRSILDWIAIEEGGGEAPDPLDELEQLFADTVQPTLVEATCFTSSCHGPAAGGIPYRLDPSVEGRFPIAATRANYRASLRMLTLDGYPLLSRLLTKSLPLGAGILHKGTNFDFYAENPHGGVEAITRWACSERRARVGEDCREGLQPISGFVFVRGPIEQRHTFDLDAFAPGRELMLAAIGDDSIEPTKVEALTADLHEGPVDIRDPAVSRDGRRVLFAMRTSKEGGHRIHEIDLVSRAHRQLTWDPGPLSGGGIATDRDPTWGPDDSVWFVSTRAGVVADRGQHLDADIYSLSEDGELRRWTHTPHIERKPVFFEVGEEAGGEVAFSALREAIPAQRRAHVFRFPPDLGTEYHQHFGINSTPTLHHDMRELPDGRYVSVVGDVDALRRIGELGIVDRNFGPELDAGGSTDETGLPLYAPPLTMLAPEDGDPGSYRDPAPLPDGRLLAARVSWPEPPATPAVATGSRIELLTLKESADGSGPKVVATTTLIDDAMMATDPEPIAVRAPVRIDAPPHPVLAGERGGVFLHNGLPMIDAILGNLQPAGPKAPADRFRYVRLVEALPQTPSERHAIPADEARDSQLFATTTSLSPHGAARILAEIELAPDGTFQAGVPAGIPFRVQGLDANRMALGTMHNRWYSVVPGQRLVQGLSAALGTTRYDSRCAACHGKADGDGLTPITLEEPDLVTGASLTLSRYENQNPRRPLEAPMLGDGTRVAIDFARDVQPFLVEKCADDSCHAGDRPAAGLGLTDAPTRWFSDAYESLLALGGGSTGGRAYVAADNGSARESFLVEMLLGRELAAPRSLASVDTVHPADDLGAPALTEAELLTLVRWIELGATFRGIARPGDDS